MICPSYDSESVPIPNWIEASALGEAELRWLLTSTAIRASTTYPPGVLAFSRLVAPLRG
jgi:hypothetical protein